MRKYLFCEAGFIEKPNWLPNCWVNVECPTPDDFDFLEKELNVPAAFLHDIADTDERPRIDSEGNWLLTILRIPIFVKDNNITYTTVPIGIITNNEIIISVCYHSTAMIPDFIEYTRRKGINVPNRYELILRLIYSSSVWFLKYLKQINNEVSTAEKELQQSIRNEDLLRLMNLQKCLVYFNTSIRGNETGPKYGEHLQRHFNRNDGCFCLHHLEQRQHHHETHDQSFHRSDGSHFDSQFLWHERRHTHRRTSARILFNRLFLRAVVCFGLHCIQKNQMVLRYFLG